MSEAIFPGGWTYRSFLNIPELVGDFNKVRFGEGELVLEVAADPGTIRGQLAFRSSPPAATDPRLTIFGSIQKGNPPALRLQGTGVRGTRAEGWVYSYVGYCVPQWPDGVNQRSALIGSVIRTVPHDGRPAGVVGSFVAVKRDFPEPRDVIPLPEEVRQMLASKGHRLHHTVWHGTRNLWLSLTDQQRAQIRQLGWQPGGNEERPALEGGTPLIKNGSGEDFLFMHRQMIQEVNGLMKQLGKAPIRGWAIIPGPGPLTREPDYNSPQPTLPTPGNPDGFAVPPTWIHPADEATNRRIAHLKTDAHYWSRMRWWDREFKNPQYLSTLTLGELGSLLEWTVHNDMHMRWATVPRHPKTGEAIPQGRADNDIRDVWDDPKYDFLGEFYSSHVNPIFWRLHGWVDDRIQDWFRAHEQAHSGEVRSAVVEGVPWFDQGKWVLTGHPWAGPMQHGHGGHGGTPHHDVDKMKQVVAILFGPPPADDARLEAVPSAGAETASRNLTWF